MSVEIRLEPRATHSIRSRLLVRKDDDLHILRLEFKRWMPVPDWIWTSVSIGYNAIYTTPFDLVILLKDLALVFRHRFDIRKKQVQRGVAFRRLHKTPDVRVHYPCIVVLEVKDRVCTFLHHEGSAEADSESAEFGYVIVHKRQAEFCETEDASGLYNGSVAKGPMDNLGVLGLVCKPETIAVESAQALYVGGPQLVCRVLTRPSSIRPMNQDVRMYVHMLANRV